MKNKLRVISVSWRWLVMLVPVVLCAVMWMNVSLLKSKMIFSHHGGNVYSAGDVALFVAMPVLHATVK